MTQTRERGLRVWCGVVAIVGLVSLAGCSGNSSQTDQTDEAAGFTAMIMQSNDADDYYERMLQVFAEQRDIDIEVIYYPGDAYNTQVTTQLQSGNAADIMILTPGTGQAVSVVTLAEAGFLEPLDAASAVIPTGTEHLYSFNGDVFGQPTGLVPVGMVYNDATATAASIDEFPSTFSALLDACATARDAGASFAVVAGAVPAGAGLLAQIIAATRVYEEDPDWNTKREAGEVTFADSDGWRETLEDIVELNEAGCFQDGAAAGAFDTIAPSLSTGSSLSAPLPGGAAQSIGSSAGIELTVHPFPAASGTTEFMNISANYTWSLNAKASDGAKTSAKDFLDWMAQPAQAAEFAKLAGLIPITGATESELLPQFAPLVGILESGSYVPLANTTWPAPAIYDALGVGVQGLLTDQLTPEAILQSMDAAWP
ncbi:extracellular solute-binding protein [Microbacterium lacus]|uniref:ABC transporter substrate-binding protein n=1 Tax=Microbacterium lacus TaxID=415217 RepID=UPI00384F4E33